MTKNIWLKLHSLSNVIASAFSVLFHCNLVTNYYKYEKPVGIKKNGDVKIKLAKTEDSPIEEINGIKFKL